MSIEQAILRIGQQKPDVLDQLRKVVCEVQSIVSDLNAAPGLIGWDLVCFRAKQLLLTRVGMTSLDLQGFDSFWSFTTRTDYYGPNLVYDPPLVYNLLLRSPHAYHQLKRVYAKLLEACTPSIREDFLEAFFKIRTGHRPQLTETETDILRLGLRKQTLSPSVLAEISRWTKGYISRVASGLKTREAIYEAVRFAYEALALEVVIVLVEMDNLDAELPTDLTRRNPWLYSLFDCKYGNRFVMANLIVPVSWRSMAEIRQWRESLLSAQRVTEVSVFERIEKECWMSFDFSAYDGKSWNITPGLYGTMIRSKYRDNPKELEIQAASPDLEDFTIGEDDIRIISVLHEKGPLSVRDLRRQIGRDYNIVRRRHDELMKRSILRKRVYPSPLFAPDSLTLVVKLNRDDHIRLCNAFSAVPEIYAQRTKEKYSIFILRLPDGESEHVAKTLNDILRGHERWLLQYSDQHFVNWQFPLDRWMNAHREWRIDLNDFGVGR